MTHHFQSAQPVLRFVLAGLVAAATAGFGASALAQATMPSPPAMSASQPPHPVMPGGKARDPMAAAHAVDDAASMPKHPATDGMKKPRAAGPDGMKHPAAGTHAGTHAGKQRGKKHGEPMADGSGAGLSAQCAALVEQARALCIARSGNAQ